jgi:hypothetical protein
MKQVRVISKSFSFALKSSTALSPHLHDAAPRGRQRQSRPLQCCPAPPQPAPVPPAVFRTQGGCALRRGNTLTYCDTIIAAFTTITQGNLYYDISCCGIGFHGDSERRKVVAVRLGAAFPLQFQWFLRSAPLGQRVNVDLHHGDM